MHKTSTNKNAIVIIGILFFVFGFVTWLNGTLIPFLKLACQLENDIQAFFVTFAFYMAYFFLAIPSSIIISKTGFKNGMALGLLIMAVGSLIFIPAANARSFGLFLTGLFIQGAGLALLQTASNPYISIIGPIESAAQRISIMGICNKVAGMLSPLILGALVLKNAGKIEAEIGKATQCEGDNRDRRRRQRFLQWPQLGEGDEFIEDELGAEQAAGRHRVICRHVEHVHDRREHCADDLLEAQIRIADPGAHACKQAVGERDQHKPGLERLQGRDRVAAEDLLAIHTPTDRPQVGGRDVVDI